MQETAAPSKGIMPLYAEDINMLEGLDDTKLEAYLDDDAKCAEHYSATIEPLDHFIRIKH